MCRAQTEFFHEDKHRYYVRCTRCLLVSVPRCFHLDDESEKIEYDKHQNSPNDWAYRQFLNRLAEPLLQKLAHGASGLDFGCGPGPTLSVMLQEQGMRVQLYDKYYNPDKRLLEQRYDFVTATEVVEHLREPSVELEKIWRCVKADGCLGVMTKLVRGREAFSRWHYKNDPTHIHFFSLTTLKYLSGKWQARLEQVASDAFIFFKLQPVNPETS